MRWPQALRELMASLSPGSARGIHIEVAVTTRIDEVHLH